MLTASSSAFALESLNFNVPYNDSATSLIKEHVTLKGLDAISTPAIAKYDLNNDFINEYIVSDKNCIEAQLLCPFLIFANTAQNQLIEIGSFTARDVKISNNTTSGVRNLNIYQNNRNHFSFDVAKWNNNAARYVLFNQEHSQ